MAKYMFANKASIEARLRTMKSRLRKAVTNAKDFPLNQLVSQTEEIMYRGVSIAAFSKSASERLAIRMFGTVRKHLNRAMTARTKPLPNTAPEERMPVNAVITILVKNGLVGYMLQRGFNAGRTDSSWLVPLVSLYNMSSLTN